jgi:hypothetical protein
VVLPFTITEKIMETPLRIRGVAMTAGLSRNFNIYTPDELQVFAGKLVEAPVYIEHVTTANSVGKVTETKWDGQRLCYVAEIYDDETAEKIRKGLIRHVSFGADYEHIDIVDGKIPHGLCNAEISLVAVPGISETNIQIIEALRLKEQDAAPIVAGEYVLGFYQDASVFMLEHFSTVWLDRENGVLAIMGKPKLQPEVQRTQAIFFSKERAHVALPNEGVDGDFRVLSAEYYVDARTQTLEMVIELGREKPLLADCMFRLKSKTDSLSR